MLKQRAPEAIRAPLLGGSLYMRHSLQSITSKDHAENQAPDNHVLDVRVGELDTTNKQFTEEVGSKRATTNGMPSVGKKSAPPMLRLCAYCARCLRPATKDVPGTIFWPKCMVNDGAP